MLFLKSNAQKEAPVINDSDSVLWVKVIKTDTNIIYPNLKHPLSICKEMQTVWLRYLREHPATDKEFCFKCDSANYFVSFSFIISQSGKVISWDAKTYHSKIKSVYNSAFKNMFLRTNWTSPYVKLKEVKKLTMITTIVNFKITANGISLLTITDENTGETFYNCL